MSKKLMTASNAIVHVIGKVCAIAGEREERRRCHDYIEWFLQTRADGKGLWSLCLDTDERSDVSKVRVTEDQVDCLMAGSLREIEQLSHTFLMFGTDVQGFRCLFICGHEDGSASSPDTGRMKALQLVQKLVPRSDNHTRDDRGGPAQAASDGKPATSWKEDTWARKDWSENAWKQSGSAWSRAGKVDDWKESAAKQRSHGPNSKAHGSSVASRPGSDWGSRPRAHSRSPMRWQRGDRQAKVRSRSPLRHPPGGGSDVYDRHARSRLQNPPRRSPRTDSKARSRSLPRHPKRSGSEVDALQTHAGLQSPHKRPPGVCAPRSRARLQSPLRCPPGIGSDTRFSNKSTGKGNSSKGISSKGTCDKFAPRARARSRSPLDRNLHEALREAPWRR